MTKMALESIAIGGYDPGIPRRAAFPAKWSAQGIARRFAWRYNRLRRALISTRPPETRSSHLHEIRALAAAPSDINEHLETMYVEAVLSRPKLIVELGVRSGVSTAVFEKVADVYGSVIISADLNDCSRVSGHPRWHFVRDDDVHFAGIFREYCSQHAIDSRIDLLFIDTSHYYDHTVEEMRVWFPLLSGSATVIFHDTNLRHLGKRKDGCFALSWDNQRGVIRAIEEHLGIQINEDVECTEIASGWLLRHWPHCNGLTILSRIQ